MEVKVIKTSQSINFEIVSEQPVSKDDAMRIQTQRGYMPMGYGFENFRYSVDKETDKVVTKWHCSSSCD